MALLGGFQTNAFQNNAFQVGVNVQVAGSYDEQARKRRKQREDVIEQIRALTELETITQAPTVKKKKPKTYEVVIPEVALTPYDDSDDLILLLVAA